MNYFKKYWAHYLTSFSFVIAVGVAYHLGSSTSFFQSRVPASSSLEANFHYPCTCVEEPGYENEGVSMDRRHHIMARTKHSSNMAIYSSNGLHGCIEKMLTLPFCAPIKLN